MTAFQRGCNRARARFDDQPPGAVAHIALSPPARRTIPVVAQSRRQAVRALDPTDIRPLERRRDALLGVRDQIERQSAPAQSGSGRSSRCQPARRGPPLLAGAQHHVDDGSLRPRLVDKLHHGVLECGLRRQPDRTPVGQEPRLTHPHRSAGTDGAGYRAARAQSPTLADPAAGRAAIAPSRIPQRHAGPRTERLPRRGQDLAAGR